MDKKYIFIIVAIVAIGLVAGATLFGNPSIERNPDELVTAVGAHGGEPEAGFDPIHGWCYASEPLIQSTLFKKDNKLNINNDLATDYSISNDGKTVNVNIRNDVKFHDNTKLTAKDVAFTYNEAKKTG